MRSSGKMLAIGVVLVITCLALAGAIAFPTKPFINIKQSDLFLFIFVSGGGVSGFVAGYYWRRLMSEKVKRKEGS